MARDPWLFGLALLSLLASAAPPTQAGEAVGHRAFAVAAAHHDAPVRGALYYPSDGGGAARLIGDNPVFFGEAVHEDAPIAPGRHPVVTMSHGLGGSMRALHWLSVGLAARGAVVVAVDHPNSATGDFDLEAGVRHWTRAQDLSAALDQLFDDARFAPHLDATRTFAAGFSYGGWTALSLGGATGRLAGYVDYCRTQGERASDCRDLARAGVDLDALDAERWNGSYKDPRIGAVAAIDPGLIHGLERADVAALVDAVLLVGLGEGADRLQATDFGPEGGDFARLSPKAAIEIVAPAWHFSSLPRCKPKGAAILRDEGEDPVCDDPPGADRAAIHQRIVDRVAAHFGL